MYAVDSSGNWGVGESQVSDYPLQAILYSTCLPFVSSLFPTVSHSLSLSFSSTLVLVFIYCVASVFLYSNSAGRGS